MQDTLRRMVTLELAGVVKHYGSRTALAGVSLRLAPGEALGLLGPNGWLSRRQASTTRVGSVPGD